MSARTPEENREYMRQYRAKNKEKTLEQQRKYQANYHKRKKAELLQLQTIVAVSKLPSGYKTRDAYNTYMRQYKHKQSERLKYLEIENQRLTACLNKALNL